jgi:hypothetical protein
MLAGPRAMVLLFTPEYPVEQEFHVEKVSPQGLPWRITRYGVGAFSASPYR